MTSKLNFIWIPNSKKALISALNNPIFITSKLFLLLPTTFYPFCYRVNVQKAFFYNSSRPDKKKKGRNSQCCRSHHEHILIWMVLKSVTQPTLHWKKRTLGEHSSEQDGHLNSMTLMTTEVWYTRYEGVIHTCLCDRCFWWLLLFDSERKKKSLQLIIHTSVQFVTQSQFTVIPHKI